MISRAGASTGRMAPERRTARLGAPAAAGSAALLMIFMICMLMPIKPVIGGQRLDPERLFLILAFVPFGLQILSGKVGRITAVDGFMLAFVLWIVVSLVTVHGTSMLSYAISQLLELLGGYMAGRALIQTIGDYKRFIRYFLTALLVMLPLGLYELFTAHMLLSEIFGRFVPVVEQNMAYRFGLARVQVVFPHSILYGLFCSLALASTFYIYRRHLLGMVVRLGLVVVATALSLSSAPLLSVFLQTGMIVWDKITRGAWKILIGMFAAVYVFLELASNRGPLILFIETVTLDPQTGWWRVYIWRYGWMNVMDHPIFGIGLNDWVRPYWMYAVSVDSFWLLIAMRHGLVGVGFLILAFALHIAFMARNKTLTGEAQDIRRGYLITLVGLIFLLATVHVWDETAAFVFFFIGAGSFLYAGRPEPAPAPASGEGGDGEPAPAGRTALPFTRFPQGRGAQRVRTAGETTDPDPGRKRRR